MFAPTLNIPAPLISLFLTEYADIFGYNANHDESASPIREVTITAPSESSDAIRSPRHQMYSDLPTPAQNAFNHDMTLPIQGATYPSRAPYDTGFVPLQQSYDAPSHPQQGYGGEFRSLNGAVQSGPANAKDSKARRRESSMLLGMGNMGGLGGMNFGRAGQRTSMMPELREDQSYPNPKDLRDRSF